jgi:hypothetical protein
MRNRVYQRPGQSNRGAGPPVKTATKLRAGLIWSRAGHLRKALAAAFMTRKRHRLPSRGGSGFSSPGLVPAERLPGFRRGRRCSRRRVRELA